MSEINQKIKDIISSNDIVLFMKGTPDAPQCGFSMAVSNILKILDIKFKGIQLDFLVEDEIRNLIKNKLHRGTIYIRVDSDLNNKNKIIFVDLKLNDIPNTMSSALIALKDLKIDYLTVHISSGLKALKEVKKVSGKTKIVGVTTLTSLNSKDLKSIGHKRSLKDIVAFQAKLANKAKLDAIVCSPHEVKFVKKY